MPTEVRKYVRLHFNKKPLRVPGIVLTRAFIIVCFVSFSNILNRKYNKIFVLELGGKSYGSKSFRFQHKRNRIEKNSVMKSFMLSVFPRLFPRSINFPILSNNDERQKCFVTCCALLVILLTEKSMSSATYRELV